MSFIYDYLKYFDIDSLDLKTTVTFIVGFGVSVVGKIKIKDIDEEKIALQSNGEIIFLYGEKLKIKSISKGEIIISGEIKKIETEKIKK